MMSDSGFKRIYKYIFQFLLFHKVTAKREIATKISKQQQIDKDNISLHLATIQTNHAIYIYNLRLHGPNLCWLIG